MIDQVHEPARPGLLVLASTYPRWKNDHEPGFVHELSRRLTSEFNVSVVCPSARGAARLETLDGVAITRFRYAPRFLETLVEGGGMTTNLRRHPWKLLLVPGFMVSMWLATLLAIRRLRPAVIHAHWIIPQGLVAILATRLGRRPPVVATAHGADLHAWRNRLMQWIKRYVISRVSLLTVVSRALAREAERIGAREQGIVVAPMGVDLVHLFRPDPKVVRSEYTILFVGRLVEKKGLRHLVDAMPVVLSRIHGARLVVAGFGPEEQARRAQTASLGLGEKVEFLGAVSQARLADLYREASVCVFPFVAAAGGDQDGLGLVAIEAAACGCPVVVSQIEATADIFRDGEATFVPPGNVAALADAVIEILLHPSSAPHPERKRLVEQFDWSGVAARYAGVLRHAVGTSPTSR